MVGDDGVQRLTDFVVTQGHVIAAHDRQLALTRDDALRALRLASGLPIWILGGDVLERVGDRFRYTGDNWSYDVPLTGHAANDSAEAGIEFVAKYPATAFFTIVYTKL